MIVEDHDMSDCLAIYGYKLRPDREPSLLSSRCGIRQPVGSNHHHSFLKRSKIDISQDVKLLLGYFECSQRNPDQRVGVKDPARNNLVDCDAVIANGLTSWARISDNRGIYTAPFSQLMVTMASQFPAGFDCGRRTMKHAYNVCSACPQQSRRAVSISSTQCSS
jgi:hypothetical protein